MKRCLLVITGAFHLGGGIAAVSRLVIRALAEAGYALDIVSLCESDAMIDPAYTAGAPVQYRVYRGNKLAFSLAVWRALLHQRYELIFCDHINLASILAPSSLLFCLKYVAWIHGAEAFPPKPDFEGMLGFKSAKKCLSSTDYTRRKVLDRFPGSPVIACDLALDPVRYSTELPVAPDAAQAEVTLQAVDGSLRPVGSQVILFVGRMDPLGRYKGQDKLLQAFPQIAAEFPGAQLVLAGGGEDHRYYQAMAQALPAGLQPAVFLPGQVSQELLNQLYQISYLFAMPSQGEGFGLVYLEAMQFAKPCIGCRDDAASCVIQDGITGLLVDSPVTAERVAEVCLRLLAEPEVARRMGWAGYAVLRERFLFTHFKQRFFYAIK